MMDKKMLSQLEAVAQWDIIVIDRGASGLRAAIDEASRGYKTSLVEQSDFLI